MRNDGGFPSVVAKDGSELWTTGYTLKGHQQNLVIDGISNEKIEIVEGESKFFA